MNTAILDPAALGEVPLERIETEITELAAHLAVAECRWLLLIAEFDRRGGYGQWGCRSTAQWLNWRCGLSLPAAHERVRVGRALSELPETMTAFSDGRLSYSKVRAITRVGRPESEADLVDLATSCTAAQLERVVRGVAWVERSLDAEARRAHLERACRIVERQDGSGTIVIDLPPESLALARAALEAVAETMAIEDFATERDESSAEDTGTPSDPWSARLADAFVRMAETALHPEAEKHSFSERFLLNLHVDLRALAGDEDGLCQIEGGPMLSSATLDRLLCDASCVPVLEVDGKPVLAGNKTPTIPRNMRRALRARDQGCRFPGCTNTRRVDAHHVVWKSKGGPTEPWNLVLLCRFHHTSIHHRGFVAQWRDGDFRFFRPDGTEIPPVPDQGRSQGPGILERHRQMDLEITPDTLPPDWGGSVLDSWGLSQAVECLLQRHGSLN